ncbi:hypothetical protein AK812_SmicGene1121 [Symbiodinium microadriaticum]|uniref:Uncharacterized protein n=1 Tax=Symbiodinium microadriaticum TaxID=2951 RepID=A0A1Q9F4T7_SYMMI|nr:hypothetical protein AK812_SmicGene1121 [Symbiodinium microadriaticum]
MEQLQLRLRARASQEYPLDVPVPGPLVDLSNVGPPSVASAHACVRQLEGRDAETLAGVPVHARPGEQSQMAPAHQRRLTGASETGRMAGSTVTRNLHFRERTLLPDMSPSACALLRSQAGPHAGAWLTAIPADPATTLSPQAMQLALRRRLRLPLPLRLNRCGPSPGCGGLVDVFGDHALACPRTGLLARRAKIVERAWVRVAREAVGADGQVVPQQWLCATTAPGVAPDDRRRLDLVIYGASPMGGALCCDATLVSPLTRTGQPQPGTVADDGAMLRVAERRKRAAYPELSSGGPQRLLVLGSEIGGRWNETAQHLVRDLARVRAQRAPPALRAAATSAWTRRWWATLAVALQQAVSSTALGSPWPAPPHASQPPGPELDRVLDLAEAAGPSRLRWCEKNIHPAQALLLPRQGLRRTAASWPSPRGPRAPTPDGAPTMDEDFRDVPLRLPSHLPHGLAALSLRWNLASRLARLAATCRACLFEMRFTFVLV